MARVAVALLLCLAAGPFVRGSIVEFKQLKIDFSDAADAGAKATWSPPSELNNGPKGLGWDGEAASNRDGWIQTKPFAVGLSWRPPYGVSVRLAIRPVPTEIKLNSGQTSVPFGGTAYVRYSPDLKHWSTWQALEPTAELLPNEKGLPARHFRGMVQVPQKERGAYGNLLSEYSTLDVPWKSDEDAAVRWIVARHPDFFENQLPFIGYVEFLFEQGFYGGQRIKSLEASAGYVLSGMSASPRDSATHTGNEGPWRFRAELDNKQGTEPSAEPDDHSAKP